MNKKPDPIPLTQEKYDQLRADQKKYLKEQEEVIQRVQTAREMGDLSENGAYKYGKFELGRVRRQLKEINHLLRWGVVVKKKNSGVIEFGSMVTLELNQKQLTYTIVTHHESNPIKGKLSQESPLGKALLGSRVGETVRVEAPSGILTYSVIEIE